MTLTVTSGSSPLACTATFSGGDPEQLTVSKSGSGSGTASSSPGGISCGSTCSAEFAQGTWVTLTAAPAGGSRFANWSGSCGTGTSSAVTLQVNGASSCTATFVHTYALTVTKTGDGTGDSLVTSDPTGVSCGTTCSATYDSGTSVTLTAEAGEGYEFAGWSGTGCTTSNSSVTVLVNQARTCTATFAAPPPPGCDAGEQSACEHDGGTWDSDLDQNGNGVVDGQGELFGQAVTGRRHPEGPANSFALLAAFDRPANGGNGDGLISAADTVFVQLRIWVEANHDGVSQPGELLTLAQAGIASIELTAQSTGRRDRFGNYFRYRAVVHLANGHQTVIWDVFLAARLTSGGASAALPAAGGMGPVATGLAGLGTGLIALGLRGVRRRTRRHGPSGPCVYAGRQERALPSAVARAGVATLAFLLLWPSASFGQSSQSWQVVEYVDTDAIGLVRAVTNSSGQVIARHDFLPFGEELTPQNEPPDKRLYTGQERDFETGRGGRARFRGLHMIRSSDLVLGFFCVGMLAVGGSAGQVCRSIRVAGVKSIFAMAPSPVGTTVLFYGSTERAEGEYLRGALFRLQLDTREGRVSRVNAPLATDPAAAVWQPDGSAAYFEADQGVYQLASGADTPALLSKGTTAGLAISSNGALLAFWRLDQDAYSLVVLDVKRRAEVRTWPLETRFGADVGSFDLAFAPDGSALYSSYSSIRKAAPPSKDSISPTAARQL